ncbi:2-hydroxyacid dehydrogenase [Microvirga terrestris]|uniref:2-hydroxyacid dehydrogenase n=1 Tax=Microvirga terrestris TaxID=2791024 RepID=A0ABS0HSB8_9HYPH|nr:2-hydroxyacid dehydrogenase [Microvirga terrestris]MBF9196379.1 2-hydroxyacid dehydrogenase [Microvirga terrestris]
MRVAVFSTTSYDRRFLDAANAHRHELDYYEPSLSAATAPLAGEAQAVCAFVNDTLDARCLAHLAKNGVRLIALRCAGFNNVDLKAASANGIMIARVPAYSPHAVAEHTLALILTLNRKTHRAYNRVREGNFSLEGLLGFDLHGKTVGVIGTGKIGQVVLRILQGFGCHCLAFDPYPNPDVEALGARYVSKAELLGQSHIITLHCPLTPETHHFIDKAAISTCRPGVMLVNTSRGSVIDTHAVIAGLKSGAIGSLALDVYEEESELFFRDHSAEIIRDDLFARLLTFPNVLLTGHQAFFTQEALTNISEITLANIDSFAQTGRPVHPVTMD